MVNRRKSSAVDSEAELLTTAPSINKLKFEEIIFERIIEFAWSLPPYGEVGINFSTQMIIE